MVKELAAQEAGTGDDQAKDIGRKDQKRQQDDCGEGWHKRQRDGAWGMKAGVAEEVKLHRQTAVIAIAFVFAPGEGADDTKAEEREQMFSFCPDRRRAPRHL